VKRHTITIVVSMMLLLTTCQYKKDDGDFCSMEFRSIMIQVNGEILDDFYTIRTQTNDTIRHQDVGAIFVNSYTVLDDNYLSKLKNAKANFIFIGIINNQIVVNELFEIAADLCHINLVSGNTEVTL
jgi:hypothetical protein